MHDVFDQFSKNTVILKFAIEIKRVSFVKISDRCLPVSDRGRDRAKFIIAQ